jgi:hypothetical protein
MNSQLRISQQANFIISLLLFYPESVGSVNLEAIQIRSSAVSTFSLYDPTIIHPIIFYLILLVPAMLQ